MNGYFNDPSKKADQIFHSWNPAGIFRQRIRQFQTMDSQICAAIEMGPQSSQSLKSCWKINWKGRPRVSRCDETSQDPELSLHLPLLLGPRAPKYHWVGVRLRLEIWCPWTPSLKLTASLHIEGVLGVHQSWVMVMISITKGRNSCWKQKIPKLSILVSP